MRKLRLILFSTQQITDEELIQEFQMTGDRELIGVLYERYTHLVYGACYKYLNNKEESKDAVMSIFERIIIRMPNTKIDSFNSWLYPIIKNECIDRIRKKKRQAGHLEKIKIIEKRGQKFMEIEGFERLSNPTSSDWTPEMLREAMKGLPREQRICLELFYFEEKGYKQIADTTKFQLKKVKSYLQNGKRNLKKILLEKQNQL